MGYLSAPEIDQLLLPSNPEFWVKLKRQAVYGDALAAQGAMLKVSQGTNGTAGQMLTEMELGAYLRILVTRMVVEWNLTDTADHLLPISEQTIEMLNPEDGEFLAAEAQKRLGKRTEAETIPFGKPSGRRSTGTR